MAENILKRKCGIYSTYPEVNLKNMTFFFAFFILGHRERESLKSFQVTPFDGTF